MMRFRPADMTVIARCDRLFICHPLCCPNLVIAPNKTRLHVSVLISVLSGRPHQNVNLSPNSTARAALKLMVLPNVLGTDRLFPGGFGLGWLKALNHSLRN